MYSLRKPPQNYHPPNHMTTPLNSKTCLSLNKPRSTHSTLSNIKLAKSSLKNTSRPAEFPLPNPLKQYHSFSSRRRKLGNYDPAKTTDTSIATQSRMLISSPLSLISLINSKNHQSLPSSMYDGDTTISLSSQRTIGRPPSPSYLGCLRPNVMFFGMCNSPATFQAFMNDLFRDYITEGWLVIYMDDLLIHFSDQATHDK